MPYFAQSLCFCSWWFVHVWNKIYLTYKSCFVFIAFTVHAMFADMCILVRFGFGRLLLLEKVYPWKLNCWAGNLALNSLTCWSDLKLFCSFFCSWLLFGIFAGKKLLCVKERYALRMGIRHGRMKLLIIRNFKCLITLAW